MGGISTLSFQSQIFSGLIWGSQKLPLQFYPPLHPKISASPINPLGLGFLPSGSFCLVHMGQLSHPLLCVLVGGLWSRTGEKLTKAELHPHTHCHVSLCPILKPEPLQARRSSYLLQQWHYYGKDQGPRVADPKVGRQCYRAGPIAVLTDKPIVFCLDCLLNWKFEGKNGRGNIPYPHQLSHWPCYFMDGGGPPLNKQPSFNPPGSLSLQEGPHAISPMSHMRDSFFDLRNWPVIKRCSPMQHDTWT